MESHADMEAVTIGGPPQVVVAHLAFDAPRVGASTTGGDPALEDLMQDLLREDREVLRGKKRPPWSASAGPRAPHG